MALWRKKVWFGWTVFCLSLRYLIGVGIGLFLVGVGLMHLVSGNFPLNGDFLSAIPIAAGALVLFWVFVNAVVLRRNIKLGMRGELRRRHCCPNCEYDLRASAIRCPECGYAIRSENVEV